MTNDARKTVLVVGATGRQGGAVARELLARGGSVRALTRQPDGSAARALAAMGAEIAHGDLDDRASLERAMAGAYGVFSVQNFWEHGAEREVAQGRAVAEAARAAAVEHFVFASVSLADSDHELIPVHFRTKGRIEAIVRDLGLPFTFVRPAFFMEMLDRRYAHESRFAADAMWALFRRELGPSGRIQLIAVDDIGRVVADLFDDPATSIGEAVQLAADELTYAELRETYRQGQRPQPRWLPLPPTRLLGWLQPELARNFEFVGKLGWSVDIVATRARFPYLRRFSEWVQENETTRRGGTPWCAATVGHA